MKQYLRLVQIAIEGFSEELSLYHIAAGTEVVYLHMSTAKTVQLPADYIDYLRIGVPVDGKLRVLTKHDNLLLPRTYYGSMVGGVFVPDTGDAVGNADSATTGDETGYIFFSDHFRNGQFVGGLYGLPGGIDDAYYRIDLETRQILFSGSTTRSEIVLEYISTGMKADGSSFIPRECVPALRTYVLWKKDENDPRISLNAKLRLEDQHDKEIAALRDFETIFTKDEYLRMIYSSSRQSPKR